MQYINLTQPRREIYTNLEKKQKTSKLIKNDAKKRLLTYLFTKTHN